MQNVPVLDQLTRDTYRQFVESPRSVVQAMSVMPSSWSVRRMLAKDVSCVLQPYIAVAESEEVTQAVHLTHRCLRLTRRQVTERLTQLQALEAELCAPVMALHNYVLSLWRFVEYLLGDLNHRYSPHFTEALRREVDEIGVDDLNHEAEANRLDFNDEDFDYSTGLTVEPAAQSPKDLKDQLIDDIVACRIVKRYGATMLPGFLRAANSAGF